MKAGIGKVLAASCAETLIDTYHVGGIVFTGIAGGVGDEVNVMDMVIGTALVQHDYGTETNDGFVWNGEAAADEKTGMIPVDAALSKLAYDSACSVLGTEKVHQGVIATGDQFIASESYVKELQTKFNALACEMEGGSVARVADQFGVPCAVIRCMSDKADGLAHDTYAFNYTEASNTSASVVMEMLKTLSTELPFTDVANTSWYFSAVSEAYAEGLMSGTSDTTFSPSGSTTRAMIVTMLYRMAEEPEVTEAASFSDVAEGKYYTDAVAWANANGIVTGYEDGTFAPNQAITREQLAVILYRYAQFMKEDTTATAALDQFSDAASVGGYAADAMSWAVAEGIVTGMTDGTLSPKTGASRAQVAVMLVRFGDLISQ